MQDKMQVAVADGVDIAVTPDAKHTVISFRLAGDASPVAVALPREQLSRLVSLMLSSAAEVAGLVSPGTPAEKMTATPMMASHIGVAKGRSDTEALISLVVGSLDLTFAVELPMLLDMCKSLQSRTVKSEPKPLQ